ncbi:MAG: polymer-forming cytoskeletal protein [Bacteroidota bacterium]
MKTTARLKASALVYTLMICTLAGVLVASLLMLFSYNRIGFDDLYFRELAVDNVDSGIKAVLYGAGDRFGERAERLFESEVDSVYARGEVWGMYGVLRVTGVHGPARRTRTVLFGAVPERAFAAALYVEDRNRPVTLAGKTRLEGLLYLPEAGLKRGFVGREGFAGEKLYRGEKRLSRGMRTGLDYKDLEGTRKMLERVAAGMGPAGRDIRSGDSLKGDWGGGTEYLGAGERVYLNDVKLSGKIVVTADEIWVGAQARLDMVQLYGRRIYFEDGFRGRVQAFATDTLQVGAACTFGYPSVLCVGNSENAGYLELGMESVLEGAVVNDAGLVRGVRKGKGLTRIQEKAEVFGNVVVPERLDIQGTVHGNVMTGKFTLQTPASVYENHLLNAVITSEGLSATYGMPLLQENPADYVLIDELE